MPCKTIRDFDLRGKRVLVRADLNVPAQNKKITDTTRIDRLRPTIDALRGAGAKIIILSHFGRPDGERTPSLSLSFLVPALEESWGAPVSFAQDCVGPAAQSAAEGLKAGDVLLLENVRFHKGEETNDPDFIKALASLGDVYVNDAFSTAHRAHASTEGLAHALPAAAGLMMTQELEALDRALENPKKPVAALVGGSKISTKLNVLYNILEKTDYLILGGAMATTFLYAQGAAVGASLCEKNMADEASAIMARAQIQGCEIVLPLDSFVVRDIRSGAPFEIVESDAIPEGCMAIDIGPRSVENIVRKMSACKTILWNGPLGVFEIKPFDAGTNAVAGEVANLTAAGKIVSIAGGGDTVAALENAGVAEKFSYISTAGGAFLEWLEGKTLPGVAALMKDGE
ncbi:MAG: phosphoglycerate kinase [Alphaproteobacteria bacterium]|nr:phosphoglycerate kinase [Alphaproteobacteria bacterium]